MSKKSPSRKLTVEVCTGRPCVEKKAGKLHRRLKSLVEQQGLKIKIKKRPCLGHCKEAPIVEISQGGQIYKKVKPKNSKGCLEKVLSSIE